MKAMCCSGDKNKEKIFIYPENKNHLIELRQELICQLKDNKKLIGVVGTMEILTKSGLEKSSQDNICITLQQQFR